LDEVFVVSRRIKVKVSVISQSLRPRLMTLKETLIIVDITKNLISESFYYTLLKKTMTNT